jgi:2-amino-4-hydroxy-6-hydroxymethyldihydropteridine diphosphokinase
MNEIYLLLGSNIGDSFQHLLNANALIQKNIGEIKEKSSIYKTAAWGKEDQEAFLNQVVRIATDKNAFELLADILYIEREMGRIRNHKNDPRIIDIDILFFNHDIIDSPTLQVPHPLLQLRNFALAPLAEVCPDFVHPIFQKKISELLSNCADRLAVDKI